MEFQDKEILRLIPQRAPFVMVDGFDMVDDKSARSTLTIGRDNYFLLPDGTMSESGLVEHIAQSASALAGCIALRQGAASAPVGLIGEVRHFTCHRRPCCGERVDTTVTYTLTLANVTLATGTCLIDGDTIATMQFKIFVQ